MIDIAKPEQVELEDVNRDNYIAEDKMDGTRIILLSDGDKTKLFNKRGKNKTNLYPEFEDLSLPKNSILDGELVVTDESHPHGNFRKLLKRDSGTWGFKKKMLYKKYKATFYAFDVLEWKGESWRRKPLRERRTKLEQICEGLHPQIEVVNSYTDIRSAWDRVTEQELEGLVLKRKESEYPEGRTKKWKKVKNTLDLERKVHNVEEHSKGIRVETKQEDQGLTINGKKAEKVKELVKEKGEAEIEVTCLERTENGSLRQPVFKRLIE